jgi:hypothetical protein
MIRTSLGRMRPAASTVIVAFRDIKQWQCYVSWTWTSIKVNFLCLYKKSMPIRAETLGTTKQGGIKYTDQSQSLRSSSPLAKAFHRSRARFITSFERVMRRDVRILLVGDGMLLLPLFNACTNTGFIEGVGKSTIVTSLIKEAFVAHVCSTLPHVIAALMAPMLGSTCRSGGYHST